MPLNLPNMSDDTFNNWLHEISDRTLGDALSDECLVKLVGVTLRETTPEARARCLVNLANLCYAMADKTLGSTAPASKFLKIVVSVGQRQ